MSETEHPHAEPAELDMDVGVGGQLADLPLTQSRLMAQIAVERPGMSTQNFTAE
jgi:hypothetical protein